MFLPKRAIWEHTRYRAFARRAKALVAPPRAATRQLERKPRPPSRVQGKAEHGVRRPSKGRACQKGSHATSPRCGSGPGVRGHARHVVLHDALASNATRFAFLRSAAMSCVAVNLIFARAWAPKTRTSTAVLPSNAGRRKPARGVWRFNWSLRSRADVSGRAREDRRGGLVADFVHVGAAQGRRALPDGLLRSQVVVVGVPLGGLSLLRALPRRPPDPPRIASPPTTIAMPTTDARERPRTTEDN